MLTKVRNALVVVGTKHLGKSTNKPCSSVMGKECNVLKNR